MKRLAHGLLAGLIGTAAMTVHQELRARLGSGDGQSEEQDSAANGNSQHDQWKVAPAPARAGKQVLERALGARIPTSAIPVLTQAMHWSYGTGWGGLYAVLRPALPDGSTAAGPLFGLVVWVASYAQLVPMGIYEPPWRYPLSSLAGEAGYHLTYGLGVALGYEAIGGLHR